MQGFVVAWIEACRSDLKTSCNFDYRGTLVEQMMLGLVAHRVGRKVEYDGGSGRIINHAQSNEHLRQAYRAGWALKG